MLVVCCVFFLDLFYKIEAANSGQPTLSRNLQKHIPSAQVVTAVASLLAIASLLAKAPITISTKVCSTISSISFSDGICVSFYCKQCTHMRDCMELLATVATPRPQLSGGPGSLYSSVAAQSQPIHSFAANDFVAPSLAPVSHQSSRGTTSYQRNSLRPLLPAHTAHDDFSSICFPDTDADQNSSIDRDFLSTAQDEHALCPAVIHPVESNLNSFELQCWPGLTTANEATRSVRGRRRNLYRILLQEASMDLAESLCSKANPKSAISDVLTSVYRRYIDSEMQEYGEKPTSNNHQELEAFRKKKNSVSSQACSLKKEFGIRLFRLMTNVMKSRLNDLCNDSRRACSISHDDSAILPSSSRDAEPRFDLVVISEDTMSDNLFSDTWLSCCVSEVDYLTGAAMRVPEFSEHEPVQRDLNLTRCVDDSTPCGSVLDNFYSGDQPTETEPMDTMDNVRSGLVRITNRILQEVSQDIHRDIEEKSVEKAEKARTEKQLEKCGGIDRSQGSRSQKVKCEIEVERSHVGDRFDFHGVGIRKSTPRCPERRKAQNCATAHRNNRFQKARYELYLEAIGRLCGLLDELNHALSSYYSLLQQNEISSSRQTAASAA